MSIYDTCLHCERPLVTDENARAVYGKETHCWSNIGDSVRCRAYVAGLDAATEKLEAKLERLQGQLDIRDRQAEADSRMYRVNLKQYERACSANFDAALRGDPAYLAKVRDHAGHKLRDIKQQLEALCKERDPRGDCCDVCDICALMLSI